MTRHQTLPDPWYFTPEELAQEWGCHAHRVRYYMDSGQIVPAALVPKAQLPTYDVLGPAPHLVVMLPQYRHLLWTHGPEDSTAPLAGEFVAFEVDGQTFQNIALEASGVYISRRSLVVTIDQKEALEDQCAAPKPKAIAQRTDRYIIGMLGRESFGERMQKPYSVARDLSIKLALRGIVLSEETIAQRIEEAAALVPAE